MKISMIEFCGIIWSLLLLMVSVATATPNPLALLPTQQPTNSPSCLSSCSGSSGTQFTCGGQCYAYDCSGSGGYSCNYGIPDCTCSSTSYSYRTIIIAVSCVVGGVCLICLSCALVQGFFDCLCCWCRRSPAADHHHHHEHEEQHKVVSLV